MGVPEQSLHNQLKDLYAGEGDGVEATVNGYIVDVVRGDVLVEVQTGNFGAIRQKLHDLLRSHRVLLVHPVPLNKWIVRVDHQGRQVSRRRSPKRGRLEEVFYELVHTPELIVCPGLELEVVMVDAEELWADDGRGSWRRRRWSIADRRLLSVVESRVFTDPRDYLGLVPEALRPGFTAGDLARESKLSSGLAQKMVYSLRKAGLLEPAGRRGRSNLYRAA
ncbi:hypothetical protein A3K81_05120 [Candidatus Bathyarchaeota archaeon RBG_13_60_20]|nr:MAG: hypothetical protein A3K81_05120 [Candidatus Bathyarchaeota archaeon RBG_13_60_20]